ncbi:hypothetical protein Tsubulata_014263 [Turnera subulata]|uniref:Uncharacterized protein n=1 Tax=Turnera subulata TaxID=218843 RepID=A0A9Q0FF15_9ROSI|nr:hypothetical protein Tsubulata_014263 [Turnera subulata]
MAMMPNNLLGWLTTVYVVLAFCTALFLGALKALIVGPVAAAILIVGNVAVILGMFPSHVAWTVYTLVKTNRFDIPFKAALALALPALFGLWLGLSVAGSVLVGLGYGFFTPWISTFEAFRYDGESKKFYHCIVDGTWGTIKGSCTVVRDFADMCYHSYPLYLKEVRESPSDEIGKLETQLKTNRMRSEMTGLKMYCRLLHVPGFIIAGLVGLVVHIPLFTAIAVIKSPYMLFKGWYRLIQDLISREGPFLETACIPIAGLTILLWPLVVVGSILGAIFSSIFIGLYAAVVVYQERSFRRGVAYVVAMVAEFDEYTNDGLYLREGTFLPKPRYRKRRASHSPENSVGGSHGKVGSNHGETPAMLVPSLVPSRSVRETIQEVKMVQIWGSAMRACEIRGKELLDAGAISCADLNNFLKAKNENEGAIINVGLPCYSMLLSFLNSIRTGSNGLLLLDGIVVNHLNRPNDKLFDWFFQPLMVLQEQIRALKLEDGEERFLQKLVLYGNDKQRMDAWDNGSVVPEEAVRAAQLQGITRRMTGMLRSVSKFPTYRRRFRQVVKALLAYYADTECPVRSNSIRSVASIENV